jgi:DNA-directed RNA polymerase subunit RPC12/RpoP
MCNAEYKVAGDNVSEKSVQARCRRCGGKFLVEPQVGQSTTLAAKMVADAAPSTPPASDSNWTTSPSKELSGSELALFAVYPELQDLRSDKLNFEEIFTPNKKGSYETRRNKFKLKILKAIHETLNGMLQSDEEVLCIGKATAYYPAEIFLGNGYLTMRYNYYAMASTSHRLLFINVNTKISKPTHYYFQIPYDGIKKVSVGLFSTSLILHRHKSKRRIFRGMKRYMAKEFLQSIRDRQRLAKAARPAEPLCEDLCPSCFMPLAKNLLKCPKCKADFKKPMAAFIRSLLLPGLGDIYLGHRLLGVIEILGSVLVWALVIFSLLQGDQAGLIVALAMLAFYNGFDGLLTRHMARKGYMLASK